MIFIINLSQLEPLQCLKQTVLQPGNVVYSVKLSLIQETRPHFLTIYDTFIFTFSHKYCVEKEKVVYFYTTEKIRVGMIVRDISSDRTKLILRFYWKISILESLEPKQCPKENVCRYVRGQLQRLFWVNKHMKIENKPL